jgi:putative transcriptional regulator
MIKIKLKRQLGIAEMTQKELCEITGIRHPTLTEYSQSKAKTISMNNLNLMCKALNCTPGDLLEYEEDKE